LWAFVLAVHVLLIVWISDVLAPPPLPLRATPLSAIAVQAALLEPAVAEKSTRVAESTKPALPVTEPVPLPFIQTPVVASPVVAAIAPAPAEAQTGLNRYALPEPFRLHYLVTKGNDSAKAVLTWRVSAHAQADSKFEYSKYELTYEATYFGVSVVKQTSFGSLTEAGLVPVRYGDKRRGKSEQATHFDADKQRITFSNNRPEALLAFGSQDRSSVLIQLASLFAGDPARWRQGQVIEIPVVSTDELETWRFEVLAEEQLALPAGERSTLHLVRRARKAFDQTVEIWLAPSLSYLPVRIRQSDSSGVTDAQLSSLDKL
jgi:hypothetical protein